MNKKELNEQKQQLAFIKGNLAEIDKLYKRLGEQNPFAGIDAEEFLDPKKFKELSEYLNDAKKEANSLFGAMDQIKEEVDEIFSGLNAVTDEITKGRQGFNLTKKTMKSLTGIMGDVKDITDGIVEGNSEDLEKLLLKAQVEGKNLGTAQELLQSKVDQGTATAQEIIALENVKGILGDQEGLYQRILDSIDKVKKQEDELADKMGNVGVAVKAVGGALDKIGMGALGKAMGLDDALKNTKKLQKEAIASNKPFNAQAHLTSEVGANLAKAFGPLAIAVALLGQLMKAFKAIDKSSGEIAKSQGISAAESRQLVALANEQAVASGDILVSTDDIVKAQSELNALLGTSAQFPAQMALDMNMMSEKMTLTGEASAFFAKQQLKGSGTIKEQLQGVSEVVLKLNEASGLSINQKEIQEGIAKLSASQRLTAAGNTKELANQVYQSKLLGLEAADLEGVQNSLLDFEQSIAAEMEAELMTGKQLNLEGARAAALKGDQAALAAEMRKEIGTIAEFEGMNVLQREALAKAFGVNVEQMTKMLEQQKILGQLQGSDYESQSAAQKAYNALVGEGMSHEQALQKMKLSGIDDAFAAQLKSASQADRMNALTERLSDLFIGIAEPLMTVLDPLLVVLTEIVNLVSYVLAPAFKAIKDTVTGIQAIFSGNVESLNKMQMILGSIATVAGTFFATFKGIKAVQAGILALKTASNEKEKQGIMLTLRKKAVGFGEAAQSVIGNAWKSLGTIPVIGAGLAAAAAVAGILFLNQKAKKKSAGDVSIDPRGGPIVSSPQEGTIFQGTRNDGVSMGPGEGLTALSGRQRVAGKWWIGFLSPSIVPCPPILFLRSYHPSLLFHGSVFVPFFPPFLVDMYAYDNRITVYQIQLIYYLSP